MISRGLSAFRDKRILLLQGPVGPFFWRFSRDLANAGATVFKINFNGGDWLFYRRDAIAFRGDIDAWPAFLEALLERLQIDVVMLFGDCRAHHRIAHRIARDKGLEVGVFEEGYIRPDYVTLERDGVNGFSALPNHPLYYLNKVPSKKIRTEPVGNTFWHAAGWACLYYLAAHALRPVFSCYRHHRPLTIRETLPWIKSFWRKMFYRVKERGVQERLTGPLSKKFFLAPLQVHTDAQIHTHSDFESVEAFIRTVVRSFAQQAPADTILVVKHHPMDRGYSDYSGLMRRLGRELEVGSRLLYIHDQHLPSLLDHARGVVLINSTVGLSALYHKAPLKVCGNSIYNIQGLVYQGPLDEFWQQAEHITVDAELFRRFRSYVIERTQLNGSFYKRLPIPGSAAGMRWEERWLPSDPDRRSADRKDGPAKIYSDLEHSSVTGVQLASLQSTSMQISQSQEIASRSNV